MPVIRYRVGDRLTLTDVSLPCRRGRTFPVLASLEGRIDDVLHTADGRRIGRLDIQGVQEPVSNIRELRYLEQARC